ncbi:MAG: META domain-containing protein [Myxococcales bacterium FL481]|nr:MAG: META domain-containing protein [Myxococcales bacterium FL481]
MATSIIPFFCLFLAGATTTSCDAESRNADVAERLLSGPSFVSKNVLKHVSWVPEIDEVVDTPPVSLEFSRGIQVLGGEVACNDFRANYVISDDRLSTSNFSSSDAECGGGPYDNVWHVSFVTSGQPLVVFEGEDLVLENDEYKVTYRCTGC